MDSYYPPDSKQLIGEALSRLEDGEGRLSPEQVVDAARSDPDGILCGLFEWDDARAGTAYRLAQARQVIREYKIWVTVTKGEDTEKQLTIKVSKYLRDPSKPNDETGYRNIRVISEDAGMAREAVRKELTAALGNVRRCLAIAHALSIYPRLEEIEAAMETLRIELA